MEYTLQLNCKYAPCIGFGSAVNGALWTGVSKMPNPKKGLAAGEHAPDFTLMPALGETPVRLADYRGQWVVLLFFRGVI